MRARPHGHRVSSIALRLLLSDPERFNQILGIPIKIIDGRYRNGNSGRNQASSIKLKPSGRGHIRWACVRVGNSIAELCGWEGIADKRVPLEANLTTDLWIIKSISSGTMVPTLPTTFETAQAAPTSRPARSISEKVATAPHNY